MHENPIYNEVNDQRYPQTVGRITLPAHHGMLADSQSLEDEELTRLSEIVAAGKAFWDAAKQGAIDFLGGDGMLSGTIKQLANKTKHYRCYIC